VTQWIFLNPSNKLYQRRTIVINKHVNGILHEIALIRRGQLYCDVHAVVLFRGNKGGYLVTTKGPDTRTVSPSDRPEQLKTERQN
jgi:hypothetical protein